jgi:hypothetical protein
MQNFQGTTDDTDVADDEEGRAGSPLPAEPGDAMNQSDGAHESDAPYHDAALLRHEFH